MIRLMSIENVLWVRRVFGANCSKLGFLVGAVDGRQGNDDCREKMQSDAMLLP